MKPEEIARYDKENLLVIMRHYPNQIQEALRLAKNVKIVDNVNKVICTGMGGSGIQLPADRFLHRFHQAGFLLGQLFDFLF